jgi:alpha-tubulin suppressor-like RCC1 family protein
VRATGEVRCWGANDHGQLGDETLISRVTPLPVAAINAASSVAVGGGHACATTASGSLQCWGANRFGQLGIGTTTMALSPTTVFAAW